MITLQAFLLSIALLVVFHVAVLYFTIGFRQFSHSFTEIQVVLAADDRLVWADTFWITPDRWLYISAAQVNRRPEFNRGRDLQQPPYAILRMRIDADPVL